jgi:very-short-patch-repair endonuclease
MGLKEILRLVSQPRSGERRRFERLAQRCNEIETLFWAAAYPKLSQLGQFTPQVNTCGYRLDFALLSGGKKFAIEVNGFETHSSKEAQSADAFRTRVLQMDGWVVVTFAARDIYLDVGACVMDVIRIVRANQ